MKTEDLFKYGVTPLEGEDAGKRYRVMCVMPDCISVSDWDKEKPALKKVLKEGEYKVWEPEKTLFEDHAIPATWGNLKKAVEAAGLGDDTLIAVPRTDWFARGYAELAEFSVEMLREPYEKPKKFIVVK